MISAPIDQITRAHIDALIANQVREGKTLDYKRDLPGATDESKRELCADVSSFANASGGDLVFGMEEAGGIPTTAIGFTCQNVDAEVQRINNILQTGIEPKIQPVDTRVLDIGNRRWILVVRVRQGWNAPHRVTRDGKFFARNSTGKYPLDVSELRDAFLRSAGVTDRIKRFREERLAKVIARQTPVALPQGAAAVMHLVPLAPDAQALAGMSVETWRRAPPPGSSGWNHRRNLDGYLTHSAVGSGVSSSYAQCFRDGSMEFVYVFEGDAADKYLPSTSLERVFINACDGGLATYKELGQEPPIYVALSLLEVGQFRLAVGQLAGFFNQPHALDRDSLILPEVLIENLHQRAHVALRPLFDMVWQSYGYDHSLNYDEAGNWRPHR